MDKIDTKAGIAAGLIGGAAYAACVFLLDLGLLMSAVPAVLLCAAVMFLAPGGPLAPRQKPTEAEAQAMSQAQEKIDSIRRAAASVTGERAANARARLAEIADKAQQILDAIRNDRNKWAVARKFVDLLMTPIEAEVVRYATLASRNIKSTAWALDQFENEALPRVAQQLSDQYAQLHVTDVAWLGTELLTKLPTIELKLEDK